jgi:hypothetical protein
MLTGTVWGIALLAVGTVTALAAMQLLLATLFPRRLDATRRALRARPWGSGVLGLVLAAALIAAVAVVGAVAKAAPVIPGALGVGAALLALFGLAAVASEVGARLASAGAAASPWRALLRGSLTVSLASLLPLVGWLVLFPAAIACGLGAWTLGFLLPEPPDDPAPARRDTATASAERAAAPAETVA